MEELGWQTQLQCPEVPEILSLFCQIPQDLSFAVGAVDFSRLDSGPISLQVQISYHSSHEPLPLAYAVLYLTCVGKWGPC